LLGIAPDVEPGGWLLSGLGGFRVELLEPQRLGFETDDEVRLFVSGLATPSGWGEVGCFIS
jgi:hypothetical protein